MTARCGTERCWGGPVFVCRCCGSFMIFDGWRAYNFDSFGIPKTPPEHRFAKQEQQEQQEPVSSGLLLRVKQLEKDKAVAAVGSDCGILSLGDVRRRSVQDPTLHAYPSIPTYYTIFLTYIYIYTHLHTTIPTYIYMYIFPIIISCVPHPEGEPLTSDRNMLQCACRRHRLQWLTRSHFQVEEICIFQIG